MERFTLWALVLTFLASCSAFDVKRDYAPEFDFTTLKTYDLLGEGPGTRIDPNSLIGSRVSEAVTYQLKQKGFELTTRDKADFLVGIEYWEREYVVPGRVGVGVGVTTGSYPTYGSWGLGYGIPQVREQDILGIRIYSAKSKQEIWQGVAIGIIDRNNPVKTIARIREAVFEIMQPFPPKGEASTAK